MKILIVGRSGYRNKKFLARLRKRGIPAADMRIVTPKGFDETVSAFPDTHFMCAYVSDSRWEKEDEYRDFFFRMEDGGSGAENSRLYHSCYDSDPSADDVYALYHMWQNLTKLVEVLIRNGSLTMNEGKVVTYLKGPDGFPNTMLYSIDNFVEDISSDPEGMAACTRAYLQLAEVAL